MVSSEFISKIEFACKKKESLYSQSKFKYAIRSMFAGAFLTFSTAAGAVGADLINKIAPGSGRFLFPFVFAWGLAYTVFLNAELVTSNMMFLTAGSFLKKISWRKTAEILLYCTLFAHSAAYANLTHDSFISGVVEMKLGRSNELVLLEAILANVFVNIAILSFVLVKDGGAKLWLVLSAIYMFVFLTNEHIAANFASFAIVKFSVAADSIANFGIGNFIGGGLLMGLPYAFLNKNEDTYVD